MRVVIVDDSEMFRSALGAYLALWESVAVVGQAANGLEALEVIEQTRPDLVLMDWVMPEMDGLAATRELRRREIGAKVMIISMHGDPAYAEHALAAGADAFVAKRRFHESFEAHVRGWFGLSLAAPAQDPPEGAPPAERHEG